MKIGTLAKGLGVFLLLILSFFPEQKFEFDGNRCSENSNSGKTHFLQSVSTSIKVVTCDLLFFTTAC